MIGYGKTVRDIRSSKGIHQKDLYDNIISKSFAIEFEKGKHDITLSLFEKILKRMNMDLDEFFYIHRELSKSAKKNHLCMNQERGNIYDLENLELLYSELSKHDGELVEVWKAFVRSRIKMVEHLLKYHEFTVDVITAKDKCTIQKYLFSIDTWTLEELKICANSIYFFEEDLQIQFLNQVIKAIQPYKNYDRARRVLCTLLINTIEVFISRGQLSSASKLLILLDSLCIYNESAFYRNISNFLKGLLKMQSNQIKEGYVQAKKAIQLMNDLHFEEIAYLYEILLDQFIQLEGIDILNY
ncbi:Rgg family transcriptional regulator [Listeria monocytogenes]|nr:Rgg family transcriptional regulator [Listeria monocytogenes]